MQSSSPNNKKTTAERAEFREPAARAAAGKPNTPTTGQQEQQREGSLTVAQANHLSSSHQNLYANETLLQRNDKPAGLASALKNAGHANQLSNSARTSAHDIHAHHQQQQSTTRRNHLFVELAEGTNSELNTLCEVCHKILTKSAAGGSAAGAKPPPACCICKSCKMRVHGQCQQLVLMDCMSRIVESSRQAAGGANCQRSGELSVAGEQQPTTSPEEAQKAGVKSSNSNVSRENIRLHRLTPSVKHIKRPDSTKPIIEGWLKHTTLSDEQARKHYWRLDETDLTLYENDTSTRYFKAIALSKITRVMSAESLPKVVKEDVLISSALIQSNGRQESPGKEASGAPSKQPEKGQAKSQNNSPLRNSPELKAQMRAMFAFELATGSMYLVQADNESEANRWLQQLAAITGTSTAKRRAEPKSPTAKEPVEAEGARPAAKSAAAEPAEQEGSRAQAAREPGAEQREPGQGAEAAAEPKAPRMQRQHHHRYPPSSYNRSQQAHKTYTDPNRSRLYARPRITIKIDSFHIPDHLIEGKYLIERNRSKGLGFEELGSGQFGKVYAAISELKSENIEKGLWSGVPVAIKEISKARFDLRQQAKLKNEANILSRLDHPGVIILERVHDLPDKIYIVMEQLEDDMLEMIVSTPEKRLNERVTKFLTYQILEALKYLHAQNIAHCDLKPENVLLVERRSQFPQIKLCDFGFAKIIEENSFRSSLVGTPAYLAPEVVKGERYNRSVDLWSVGVIVYVSLSGEFPFNEGENIHDQISIANFMYPEQPWGNISAQAKSFINSLLRVNCEKRLSANRAQMDDWIQDFQLWCDLSELEVRVGKRWVTDDADFERWSRYAKEHKLQVPRAAYQLHDELQAD